MSVWNIMEVDWLIETFCSPKVELPNKMGYVAYFTDSEKNVMGLWSMK